MGVQSIDKGRSVIDRLRRTLGRAASSMCGQTSSLLQMSVLVLSILLCILPLANAGIEGHSTLRVISGDMINLTNLTHDQFRECALRFFFMYQHEDNFDCDGNYFPENRSRCSLINGDFKRCSNITYDNATNTVLLKSGEDPITLCYEKECPGGPTEVYSLTTYPKTTGTTVGAATESTTQATLKTNQDTTGWCDVIIAYLVMAIAVLAIIGCEDKKGKPQCK